MQYYDPYWEDKNFEERRRIRAEHRREHELRQKKRTRILFASIAGMLLLCTLFALLAVFLMDGKKDGRKAGEKAAEEESQEIREIVLSEADPLLAGSIYSNEAESDRELMDGLVEAKLPEGSAMTLVEMPKQGSDDTALLEAGALTGVALLNTTPDEKTQAVGEEVDSAYVILVSLEDNRVLCARQSDARMYPASMTKVMTVLVAAEHLRSMDALGEIFEMTRDIESYSYVNGCSNVGFSVGERVTIADLFYGTILPSGADAAIALAEYTAGSQEAFAELMNEKAEELGIGGSTHFVNCVGLYDDNHYSTAADMAVIMNAAMDNPICREVLSRHIYTTTHTSFHPDGITISNLFLRRIEDHQPTGIVLGAKTGFVNQSLNCAVSYGEDEGGRAYICVTGSAHGAWQAIRDHVALYSKYFDAESTGGENPSENAAAAQEDGA